MDERVLEASSIKAFDVEAIEVTLGWVASQFLLDAVICILVKFSLYFFTSAEVVLGLEIFLGISRYITLVSCFFHLYGLLKLLHSYLIAQFHVCIVCEMHFLLSSNEKSNMETCHLRDKAVESKFFYLP